MARIAVIGPGAVGGLVAAWLATDESHGISLGARTPFPELVVTTAKGVLRSEPRFLEIGSMRESIDWILFATKAYDAEAAAKWIPVLANEETRVAVLQNGVEHRRFFADRIEVERLLPVVADCPAEREAPGVVTQMGEASLVVERGLLGESFAELFRKTDIAVEQSEEFAERAWRKLSLNAAGVVSALTLRPAGVVHEKPARELMRGIALECIRVARTRGVFLSDSVADEVIARCEQSNPESINSLHADRMAGRPMEIDARNGVIVRYGKDAGVPTPFNEMAVALLRLGLERC